MEKVSTRTVAFAAAAAAVFLSNVVAALESPLATVTRRADPTRDESPPRPTPWHSPRRSTGKNGLRRRQSSGEEDQIILLREDNTCGFIDGDDNEPYTCAEMDGEKGRCGLKSATNSDSFGDVLCCYSTGCYSNLYCMDYNDYTALSCEGECIRDPSVITCTDSARGTCGQVILDGRLADISCDAGSTSWTQYADTFVADDQGQIVTDLAFNSTRLGDITIDAPNSTTTSTPIGPATTPPPGSEPSTTAAAPPTTETAEATVGPPPGVIAGSVVGGSVALALGGLAIFIVRRKKRINAAIASGTVSPATFRTMRSPPPRPPRSTPASAKRISAKGSANGMSAKGSAKRNSARVSTNGVPTKKTKKRTSAPGMSQAAAKSIKYPGPGLAELPANEISPQEMARKGSSPLGNIGGEDTHAGLELAGFRVQTIRKSRTF